MAGDDSIDAAFIGALNNVANISKGLYIDLNEVSEFDFSKPWWDKNSMKYYEIADKLYMAHNETSANLHDTLWVGFFNKKLHENLKLEDIYALVRDGKWTIDKLKEFIEVGQNDLDGDGEPDINVDTGDGFTLFSVRGVIAFFAIGGWVGYIFAETSAALAIVLSVVAGSLALVAMAFIMRGIMKMRSDGNIDIKRAIGKTADVYLTVPAKDNGNGKVTLTLEERFVELNAIQNGDEAITTGSKVKITDVSGDCVIVEKI